MGWETLYVCGLGQWLNLPLRGEVSVKQRTTKCHEGGRMKTWYFSPFLSLSLSSPAFPPLIQFSSLASQCEAAESEGGGRVRSEESNKRERERERERRERRERERERERERGGNPGITTPNLHSFHDGRRLSIWGWGAFLTFVPCIHSFRIERPLLSSDVQPPLHLRGERRLCLLRVPRLRRGEENLFTATSSKSQFTSKTVQ